MKGFGRTVIVILIVLLLSYPMLMHARKLVKPHGNDENQKTESVQKLMKQESKSGSNPMIRVEPMQVAGSSLPDCTHACGSCTPCRLVMVSYKCSTVQEAESCPMTYKCMCKNKAYPVP